MRPDGTDSTGAASQLLRGKAGYYSINPSEPLAYGRISVLFVATDEKDKTVCIKLFRDRVTTSSGDVDFSRELGVVSTLSHPSILPILDFGVSDEGHPRPFIVLPLCEGGNLRALLEARSFLPLDIALTYLRQIAGALDHSHRSGIIHGDVKPENVLIGSNGSAFLADFGAARYQLRTWTRTPQTTAAGLSGPFTEYYASPEQITKGVQSVRSDVYSFAMVAYEILTGKPPIDPALPIYERMEAKVFGRIVQPLEANPALPAGAGEALLQGLATKPGDRPASAGDLVLAIERGFAVRGLPESTARRGSRDVFLVHGHDEALKERVARFLERLGLQVSVLHELASGGRTLIEKVEAYSGVTAAVVLLTPDDLGAAAADKSGLKPRARQNVVFELGYFCAKLGRTGTIALHGDVELPSDVAGVAYIHLDAVGAWRLELVRELRAAGLLVDANAAFG